MSACPGCSMEAWWWPEPCRSPTAGPRTRPSATDACCCSKSLEKRRRGEKNDKMCHFSFVKHADLPFPPQDMKQEMLNIHTLLQHTWHQTLSLICSLLKMTQRNSSGEHQTRKSLNSLSLFAGSQASCQARREEHIYVPALNSKEWNTEKKHGAEAFLLCNAFYLHCVWVHCSLDQRSKEMLEQKRKGCFTATYWWLKRLFRRKGNIPHVSPYIMTYLK